MVRKEHQPADDGLFWKAQCKTSWVLQLLWGYWELQQFVIFLQSSDGDIIQAIEP